MKFLALYLVLLLPSLAFSLPPEFYSPDDQNMVPIEDWGLAYDGETDPNYPSGLGPCPTDTVEDPDSTQGQTSVPGGVEVPCPTIEDPDAAGGNCRCYDTNVDGVADCAVCGDAAECATGDEVCACLAENRAELQAIKALLEGADFPGIKNLLNQMLESEAELTPPSNPAPWAAITPIASLPFEGMPVHSVLQNSADEDFGFSDPSEMVQRTITVNLSNETPGVPDFPVSFSTDPQQWAVLSDEMETVRLFVRGFFLVVLYFIAFQQVWSMIMGL